MTTRIYATENDRLIVTGYYGGDRGRLVQICYVCSSGEALYDLTLNEAAELAENLSEYLAGRASQGPDRREPPSTAGALDRLARAVERIARTMEG